MTANVSDLLVVVVCFFAVTKPASICNHKKSRNDSLQITRSHLLECWFHFIIRISVLFDGCSADKISAANSAIGGGLESSFTEAWTLLPCTLNWYSCWFLHVSRGFLTVMATGSVLQEHHWRSTIRQNVVSLRLDMWLLVRINDCSGDGTSVQIGRSHSEYTACRQLLRPIHIGDGMWQRVRSWAGQASGLAGVPRVCRVPDGERWNRVEEEVLRATTRDFTWCRETRQRQKGVWTGRHRPARWSWYKTVRFFMLRIYRYFIVIVIIKLMQSWHCMILDHFLNWLDIKFRSQILPNAFQSFCRSICVIVSESSPTSNVDLQA